MKDCKNPLKGTVCFGDCIHDTGANTRWPLTLMTPDPGMSGFAEKVCADELLEVMRTLKPSSAVFERVCQDYFLQSLKLRKDQYLSCAAYRGTANCEALFQGL